MKVNATAAKRAKKKVAQKKGYSDVTEGNAQHKRGYLWMVERRVANVRTRKFFRHGEADEREQYIAEIDSKIADLARKDHGILSNPAVLGEASQAMKDLEPFGKSIAEAVAHYVEFLKSEQDRDRTPVCEVVSAYLRTKEKKSARHYRDLKSRLGRFEEDFADRELSGITKIEMRDWIAGLGLEPQTQLNYKTVISGLFYYAKKAEILTGANPLTDIEVDEVVERETVTLEAGEVASLLFNASAELLPALVLMAFCGLRNSEVVKKTGAGEQDSFLDWSSINWRSQTITIQGNQAKKTKKKSSRRVVDIPDNAIQWLKTVKKLRGPIAEFDSADLFNDALVKLRVKSGFGDGKWPHNALRKTFISCHFASHKNENETAAQAGNSPAAIRTFYLDLIEKEDALRLWEIRPEGEANGKVVNL